MKTLIIASMIAFSGTAALIAPTQAASLIIQSDDGDQYSPDNDQIQIRRYHERQRVELVKHWRHHHRVIEQVRVCG
jgi:hypothetical protein